MPIQISLNQTVRLRLTETGRDVYQSYIDRYSMPNKALESPREINLPLWEFAHIFGPMLTMGQTAAPFTERNAIELETIDEHAAKLYPESAALIFAAPELLSALKALSGAVAECRDTELADIACIGSMAPCEDAMGRLFRADDIAKAAIAPFA